jgi:Metal-dependent hydrolases of the beta-lactamase superfamily III
VDAVVITHFHLDHWGDLVPWAFGACFGPGRGTPAAGSLAAPGRYRDAQGPGADVQLRSDPRSVLVHEYADETPFHAAGFEVTATRVVHYDLLSFGLRVTDGEKTLAYSGDSGPSPALAHLARKPTCSSVKPHLPSPSPRYAAT